MADPSPARPPGPPSTPTDRTEALGALLSGTGRDGELDRFEQLLESRGCPAKALQMSRTPAGGIVSALVVPGPGRVGMVLLAPLPGTAAAPLAVATVIAAVWSRVRQCFS